MGASATNRVEPEAPAIPAGSAAATKPDGAAVPAAASGPSPAPAASAEQLARIEDKLARIEEKLARSEAQILRMEDRVEHFSAAAAGLASQEAVDRANARLRLLPGFPSLIVAAILAGVIAAALIALVQRAGLAA